MSVRLSALEEESWGSSRIAETVVGADDSRRVTIERSKRLSHSAFTESRRPHEP